MIDGQIYYEGDLVHDLGTLECIKVTGDNQRHYHALDGGDDDYIRAHAPHYVDGGSDIFCLDSGKVWVFHKKTDQWVKLP